ncbi:MAG: hypothetical protein ACRDYZ_12555 [Acidimicrobiales bacterium]
MPVRRALVAGWFSFLHGEATAGDLDALATVRRWLDRAGVGHEDAWSPAFGGPETEAVDPAGFTDLVYVCGPLAGPPVEGLARRFAGRRRLAVGVSAVDPAAAHFDAVLARDGAGVAVPDLAVRRPRRHPRAVARLLPRSGGGGGGDPGRGLGGGRARDPRGPVPGSVGA